MRGNISRSYRQYAYECLNQSLPGQVYSVALYAADSLKGKLSALSASRQKKQALQELSEGAGSDEPISFVLNMNMKVGAEKMASAIADAVAPRHSGDPSDVKALESLIFEGVEKKGAATKGTTMQFDCSSDGVGVAVDGSSQGTVESSGLACAFCDVYLDDNSVSQSLRQNCIENCCME
mmetsp:Transcript_14293/g.31307  ORF Transcript_14293/g.31307 Transcript_14293/m.31307 type:complete len:179 (-) Transcript_14293:411-947(-)